MTLSFIFNLIRTKYESNDIIEALKNFQVFSSVRPYSKSVVETFVYYDSSLGILDLKNSKLVKDLINWLDKFSRIQPFSLELLSETMEEFHYQSSKIIYYDSFAKYITLQIVYFLNALLKANIKYYNTESPKVIRRIRSYSNAIDDLKINIKNSEIDSYSSAESFTLFKFFYECPIWNYLITLHGFKEIKIKPIQEKVKSFEQLTFFDDEFGFANDIIEDNIIEESISYENKFFKLLDKLELHIQDASKKDKEEIKTDIDYAITVDDFLKIYNAYQESLTDYKVQSKSELNENIRTKYIDILKSQYKKRVQFRSKHTRPIVDKAILIFSGIEQ